MLCLFKGEMDEETLKAMRQTRCGNPYRKSKKNLRDMRPKRKRRDLSDGRWDSRELTYRIVNYPSWTEMTQEDVSMQIKKAFNVWSEAAQVDFVQKREGVANIAISFLKEHTDTLEPFDGENGTLAHAYYPDSNRTETEVHFDDDEYFTSDANGKGVDLFQLSVHEIGHSLGILHRKLNKESIMFELYRYRQSFALHSDDIKDIQDLFGKRRNNTVDPPPELCFDPAFDAITRTEDGTTYMFKGNFYWRLTNDDILKDSPGRIKADWPGLPGSLDAAATLPDGRTYFFKNDQCWIFRNRKRESGPKFISSLFPGAPDNINAAFYWNIDQHTYFFKGDGYWKFNGNKIAGTDYPRLIANAWKGVPDDLNDVFTWQDGKTYFFKDKKYYRFNVDDDEVSRTH